MRLWATDVTPVYYWKPMGIIPSAMFPGGNNAVLDKLTETVMYTLIITSSCWERLFELWR